MTISKTSKMFDFGIYCHDLSLLDLSKVIPEQSNAVIIGDLCPKDIDSILQSNNKKLYFLPQKIEIGRLNHIDKIRDAYVQGRMAHQTSTGVSWKEGIYHLSSLTPLGNSSLKAPLSANTPNHDAIGLVKLTDSNFQDKYSHSTSYKPIFEMPILIRPLNLTEFFVRKFGLRFKYWIAKPFLLLGDPILKYSFIRSKNSISITETNQFPNEIDKELAKFSSHFNLCGSRDSDKLNKHFFSNRDHGYKLFIAKSENKIIGYMVVKFHRFGRFQSLAIVDIVAFDLSHDTYSTLLAKAHKYALTEKLHLIALLANQKGPLYSIASSLFYTKSIKKRVFSLLTSSEKPVDKNIIDNNKTYITWYDSDEFHLT